MNVRIPRLVVAGLSGDSGKTIVCLSLVTALRKKGLKTAVFKKGPDYIDSAWLTRLAGALCRNLDTFMVEPQNLYDSFINNTRNFDIAIVEGNRGIFDGMDIEGTHSTAGLAKILHAPIVLVINCSKATRTIAAIVKGCIEFDSEIKIAGVILNNVAGERHKKVIAGSVEKYTGLPVLGAIPRLTENEKLIPGRHLGLIPPSEFATDEKLVGLLSEIAEKFLDVDRMVEIAKNVDDMRLNIQPEFEKKSVDVKIGYFNDSVFTFYYPENLEALKNEGAELVRISSLNNKSLPEIDALYIGGGFPETFAERLVQNQSMLESVKNAAEGGLPIYAECGGLIYLSRSLIFENRKYFFANIFPIDLEMNKKPIGHGYTTLVTDNINPYFPIGTMIKGHEFHYSGLSANCSSEYKTCMTVKSGTGVAGKRDGLLYKCTFAAYTHIHADGALGWATAMVKNAANYKKYRLRNNRSTNMDSDTNVNERDFPCYEIAEEINRGVSAG
jgi:cobyrinic acid a,c-diamide synthase